jgi:hypothetical protein
MQEQLPFALKSAHPVSGNSRCSLYNFVMLQVLLEQPNGLARRIVSKAGSDPSRLLERTEAFIRQQPRVTGDSAQALPSPIPSASRRRLLSGSHLFTI